MAAEVIEQENAIVLAAAEKLVALGRAISERLVDGKAGKNSEADYQQGYDILQLLTAYKDNSFTNPELEAVLYDLRGLSGAYDFPTVSPIVGQELIYLVDTESGGSGTTITPQNNGSTLSQRDYWNFYNGLTSSDDGTRINIGLGGTLTVAATIQLGAVDLSIDASGAGDFAISVGSDATGDLLYRNSSGKLARLGITTGILGVTAGLPAWQTVTAPLVMTAGALSMPVATSIANGYLSSTDWSTFNNKQAALGYTPINHAGDTGISGTLTFDTSFGIDNAGVLPIGASATQVTLGGTELVIKDKLFTINNGGAAASGFGAGFEINENAVITGYFKTTVARTGFAVKPPATAGVTNLIFGATTTRNATFQDASGTLAYLTDVAAPFSDASALVRNSADATKLAIFSAASISAGTTRTYTLQNSNGTLAFLTDITPGISGLTTNRIPYATSATTLGDDSALLWDATNNAITVGVGKFHTTGTKSTFVGENAGNFTVAGTRNTTLGADTGCVLAAGGNNTLIGYTAGLALTDGTRNTAIGSEALAGITTTLDNTSVGARSLQVTTGSQNVALGSGAGLVVSTGSTNTLLGYLAGDNVTSGSNNVVIGANIDAQSTTTSNQLSIQNILFGSGNSATGTTVSSGNLGIGATSWGTSASKVVALGDGTAPSTSPAAMIQYYSESGVYKYRDSSGNVVTI